jgi:hypothetical protein
MERKSPALFWTGVGLVTGGSLAVVLGAVGIGLAARNGFGDGGAGPGIGSLVLGGVLLGVGIPFMAVFGARVPAEPEPAAFTVVPILTPGGAGLVGAF